MNILSFRWTENSRSLLIELVASGHWKIKAQPCLLTQGVSLPTCPLIPPSQGLDLESHMHSFEYTGNTGEEKEPNCWIQVPKSLSYLVPWEKGRPKFNWRDLSKVHSEQEKLKWTWASVTDDFAYWSLWQREAASTQRYPSGFCTWHNWQTGTSFLENGY